MNRIVGQIIYVLRLHWKDEDSDGTDAVLVFSSYARACRRAVQYCRKSGGRLTRPVKESDYSAWVGYSKRDRAAERDEGGRSPYTTLYANLYRREVLA